MADEEVTNPPRFSVLRPSFGRVPLQDLNVISTYDEDPTGTTTATSAITALKRRVSFNNKFNVKEFIAEERTSHVLLAPEYEEPLSCLSSDSSCQQQTTSSVGSITQTEFVENLEYHSNERIEVSCTNVIREKVEVENVKICSNSYSGDKKYRRRSIGGSFNNLIAEGVTTSIADNDVELTMAFSPFIDVIDTDANKRDNSGMDMDEEVEHVQNNVMPSADTFLNEDISCDESDMSFTRPIPAVAASMHGEVDTYMSEPLDESEMSLTRAFSSVPSKVRDVLSETYENGMSLPLKNDTKSFKDNVSDMSMTRGLASATRNKSSEMSISSICNMQSDIGNQTSDLIRDATLGLNNSSNMSITKAVPSLDKYNAGEFCTSRSALSFQSGNLRNESSARDILMENGAIDMRTGIVKPFMKHSSETASTSKNVSSCWKTSTSEMTKEMEIVQRGNVSNVSITSVLPAVMSETTERRGQSTNNNSSDMSMTRGPFGVNIASDMNMTKGSLAVNNCSDMSMTRGPLAVNNASDMSMTRCPLAVSNASDMSMTRGPLTVNNASDMSMTRGPLTVNNASNMSMTRGPLEVNNASDMSFTKGLLPVHNASDKSLSRGPLTVSNACDMSMTRGPSAINNTRDTDVTREQPDHNTSEMSSSRVPYNPSDISTSKGPPVQNASVMNMPTDQTMAYCMINFNESNITQNQSPSYRSNNVIGVSESNNIFVGISTKLDNLKVHLPEPIDADNSDSECISFTDPFKSIQGDNLVNCSQRKEHCSDANEHKKKSRICLLDRSAEKENHSFVQSISAFAKPTINESTLCPIEADTDDTLNFSFTKHGNVNVNKTSSSGTEEVLYELVTTQSDVRCAENKTIKNNMNSSKENYIDNDNNKPGMDNLPEVNSNFGKSNIILETNGLEQGHIISPDGGSSASIIGRSNEINNLNESKTNHSCEENREFQIKNLQISENVHESGVTEKTSSDKIMHHRENLSSLNESHSNSSLSTGSKKSTGTTIINRYIQSVNSIHADDNIENQKDVNKTNSMDVLDNSVDINSVKVSPPKNDSDSVALNNVKCKEKSDVVTNLSYIAGASDERKTKERIETTENSTEIYGSGERRVAAASRNRQGECSSISLHLETDLSQTSKGIQEFENISPAPVNNNSADGNRYDSDSGLNINLKNIDLSYVNVRKRSYRNTFPEENIDDCDSDIRRSTDVVHDVTLTSIVDNNKENPTELVCTTHSGAEEVCSAVQHQISTSFERASSVSLKRKSESFASDGGDDNDFVGSPLKIPRNDSEINEEGVVIRGEMSSLMSDSDMETSSSLMEKTHEKPAQQNIVKKYKLPCADLKFRSYDRCQFKFLPDNSFSWLFFDGVLCLVVETYPENEKDGRILIKHVQMHLNEPDELDQHVTIFAKHVKHKFQDSLEKFENTDDICPLLTSISSYIEDNKKLFKKLSKYFCFYPLKPIEDNRLLYEVVSAKNIWFEVTMPDKIVFHRITDKEITFKNVIGCTRSTDVQHLLRMCSHPLENQLIKFIDLLEEFKRK